MLLTIGLTVLAWTAATPDESGLFVARVERTEMLVNGQPRPRVEKDDQGNVVRLMLDGMTLSAEDVLALARLPSVEQLSLNRTNVTDADLAKLRGLVKLRGLALNSTDVTDAAIEQLQHFPALRSLCLGDVLITPQAVSELKEHCPRLQLGYYQRRK